jgi:hypothetical protein
MDPMPFVFILCALVTGIGLFVGGFKWSEEKRLIENTPTSKVRSLAMGMVEVFGEAVPAKGSLLKGPLSSKDCVYYKYEIQEQRKSKNSTYWATIRSGEERKPFYIKDETGTVLVDPNGASLELPQDFEFHSSWGKDPPETVMNFLKTNKISFEGWFGINKTMRFIEYIIAPGDKLFVMGTAGDNPYVEEGTAQFSAADIMIQKAKSLFFISDKGEKQVLAEYGTKILFGYLFGIILIIIGLIGILLMSGIFWR